LTKFHERYKAKGFQVLAVDGDDSESREKVADYAQKHKLTHPIVLQGEKVAELYETDGVMPTAFWIDQRGRVVRREVGFSPEMDREIERTIQDLLKEKDRT